MGGLKGKRSPQLETYLVFKETSVQLIKLKQLTEMLVFLKTSQVKNAIKQ